MLQFENKTEISVVFTVELYATVSRRQPGNVVAAIQPWWVIAGVVWRVQITLWSLQPRVATSFRQAHHRH